MNKSQLKQLIREELNRKITESDSGEMYEPGEYQISSYNIDSFDLDDEYVILTKPMSHDEVMGILKKIPHQTRLETGYKVPKIHTI